jgi:hypothetical protein
MVSENIFLLHALLLGLLVIFVYDLLIILRRVVSHSRFWVSVEDLGFWIFCGIEVFLLMYRESNGTLRWFAVLGALTGMTLYKKTVSRPLVHYVSLFFRKTLEILGKLIGFLLKPLFLIRKAAKKTARWTFSRQKIARAFLKNKLTNRIKVLKMVFKKR